MQLRIELRTERHELAAGRFNVRLRDAKAPIDFFLPEKVATENPPASSAVSKRYYVVLEDGEVRASVYVQDQPAWVGGTVHSVWNVQSIISEGIVNPNYSSVALFLMKELLKRNPLIYSVGMGSETMPYPRLLKALRWDVSPVPFFFRVRRAPKFLQNLQSLRRHHLKRALADIGAYTGIGSFLIHAYQTLKSNMPEAVATYDRLDQFDDWVDQVWEKAKKELSFSIESTAGVLNALLPIADDRLFRLRIISEGSAIGWAILLISDYRSHTHFGNMRVGTIVDAMSWPGKERSVVAAALDALSEHRVDLAIANERQQSWQRAFGSAGFLRGPSNYLLGLSPQLAATISAHGHYQRIHVNRADGDGICNL
jgi:hypothetical protein